jgi:hypothetical protein
LTALPVAGRQPQTTFSEEGCERRVKKYSVSGSKSVTVTAGSAVVWSANGREVGVAESAT